MERRLPHNESGPKKIGDKLEKQQKERRIALAKKIGIGAAGLAVAAGLATGLYFSWDSIAHFFAHLFTSHSTTKTKVTPENPHPGGIWV